MMQLRNMVGIAFFAMSLLTGFAVTSASAQEAPFCQIDPAVCAGQHQDYLELLDR